MRSRIRVSYAVRISTTLIGAELHPGQIQSGSFWHLLAVGLPLDFETHRPDDSGADVANRAREAGAFVAVPHPNWIALTVEDFETLEAVHAVECYNGLCDRDSDRGYSWHYIDLLLHRGHRVGAIATDDTHMHGDLGDFMRGWVYVKSEALEPDALLKALKAGHYYSSTGAQLHHVAFSGRGQAGGGVFRRRSRFCSLALVRASGAGFAAPA